MQPSYVPVLKTTDSELRAVKFLSADVKDNIMPLFELTRSRKTKALPEGSASRRMQQLLEIYGSGRFILDVTTEEDLLNSEIISFFDEDEGYRQWSDFLRDNTSDETIPCVLYSEDGSKVNFCNQVRTLLTRHKKICIRGGVSDSNLVRQLYMWALEVADYSKIIIGGSVYFIARGMLPNAELESRQFIASVVGNTPPSMIFVSSSSYPKYVVETGYGNDAGGEFRALERDLTLNVQNALPNLPIVHSDYASVHPIRYNTSARGWVPRVDGVGDSLYSFRRYRDSDGGYARAAREVYSRLRSQLVECWGTEQIRDAAIHGRLGGRSPSFWISVRVNQWITANVNS